MFLPIFFVVLVERTRKKRFEFCRTFLHVMLKRHSLSQTTLLRVMLSIMQRGISHRFSKQFLHVNVSSFRRVANPELRQAVVQRRWFSAKVTVYKDDVESLSALLRKPTTLGLCCTFEAGDGFLGPTLQRSVNLSTFMG